MCLSSERLRTAIPVRDSHTEAVYFPETAPQLQHCTPGKQASRAKQSRPSTVGAISQKGMSLVPLSLTLARGHKRRALGGHPIQGVHLAAENALQGQVQSRMFLAVQDIHGQPTPRIFDRLPLLAKYNLCAGLPTAQHQGCEHVNQAPALHFWKDFEQHSLDTSVMLPKSCC